MGWTNSRIDLSIVVEHRGSGVDSVQVEVGVLSQVDRGGLVCGGLHGDLHLIVFCQKVSDSCCQVAWVALQVENCWFEVSPFASLIGAKLVGDHVDCSKEHAGKSSQGGLRRSGLIVLQWVLNKACLAFTSIQRQITNMNFVEGVSLPGHHLG